MAKPIVLRFAHTPEEESLFVKEGKYMGHVHYSYLALEIKMTTERASYTVYPKHSKDIPLVTVTMFGHLEKIQSDIDDALGNYYHNRLEKTNFELKKQDFIACFHQLRIGDFFTKETVSVSTNISYIIPPIELSIQTKNLGLSTTNRDRYVDWFKKLNDKGYISQQRLSALLGVVGYSVLEEFQDDLEKPQSKKNSFLT